MHADCLDVMPDGLAELLIITTATIKDYASFDVVSPFVGLLQVSSAMLSDYFICSGSNAFANDRHEKGRDVYRQ